MNIFFASVVLGNLMWSAHAESTSVAGGESKAASPRAPARVYIPDDSDPCDFERFKQDASMGAWIRAMSPNTATHATCYHVATKILPVASKLLEQIDGRRMTLVGGEMVRLAAAGLTGFTIDSFIEVEKDGKRYVGLVLKSGVNGPTISQVYVAK